MAYDYEAEDHELGETFDRVTRDMSEIDAAIRTVTAARKILRDPKMRAAMRDRVDEQRRAVAGKEG